MEREWVLPGSSLGRRSRSQRAMLSLAVEIFSRRQLRSPSLFRLNSRSRTDRGHSGLLLVPDSATMTPCLKPCASISTKDMVISSITTQASCSSVYDLRSSAHADAL